MRIFRNLLIVLAVAAPLSFAHADDTAGLWKKKCATCHGPDGKGQTKLGKKMELKDLTDAKWQKSVTDDQIKKVINEGIKTEENGVKKKMKAFKGMLDEAQIDSLVKYVRTLK